VNRNPRARTKKADKITKTGGRAAHSQSEDTPQSDLQSKRRKKILRKGKKGGEREVNEVGGKRRCPAFLSSFVLAQIGTHKVKRQKKRPGLLVRRVPWKGRKADYEAIPKEPRRGGRGESNLQTSGPREKEKSIRLGSMPSGRAGIRGDTTIKEMQPQQA